MTEMPRLEWAGPDEDGEMTVMLQGVTQWHLVAHGRTVQAALARLGERLFAAHQMDLDYRTLMKKT